MNTKDARLQNALYFLIDLEKDLLKNGEYDKHCKEIRYHIETVSSLIKESESSKKTDDFLKDIVKIAIAEIIKLFSNI